MRRLSTAASLWFACGVLAGCGGGGGSSGTNGGVPSAGSPASSPALSASQPSSSPVSAPVGWRLVWSDEFEGTGLPDPLKWGFDTDRNSLGWYNNEKQYYSNNRLANASVKDGYLTITAVKETINAPDSNGQAYTSARMLTRGTASWTYGFFEVRAKLPCSLGTWPAIWTLGTGGRWPEDGEIDLMEQRGITATDKTVVLGTMHTRAYKSCYGTLSVGLGSSMSVSDACTNFHSYQLIWDEGKVAIGVDDVTYFTYPKPASFDNSTWPFDNPQYLILNLAMGGDLGGAIPANFVADRMVVDYVRVYQR